MGNVRDIGFWVQVIAEVKSLVDQGKAASKDGFTISEILELVNKVLGVLQKHGVQIDEISKLISEVAPLIALLIKK